MGLLLEPQLARWLEPHLVLQSGPLLEQHMEGHGLVQLVEGLAWMPMMSHQSLQCSQRSRSLVMLDDEGLGLG